VQSDDDYSLLRGQRRVILVRRGQRRWKTIVNASTAPEYRAVAQAFAFAAPAATSDYLALQLGMQEFGIDAAAVREIRRYEHPAPIANVPTYIRGVLNLRGRYIPIVDLRLKYGLKQDGEVDQNIVVIVNAGASTLGLVVDAVAGVAEFSAEEIAVAREGVDGLGTGLIVGMAALSSLDGERELILIDLQRVFGQVESALRIPFPSI